MRNRKNKIIQIMVLFSTMISCGQQNNVTPFVSFNKDILPIFRASCAINSSCHLGADNTNRFINLSDSTAYTTLINKQLINTATPTASLLYVEVFNGIMPKAPFNALTTDEINLILNWIKDGCKNN